MNVEGFIAGRLRIPVPDVAKAFSFTRQFIYVEVARGKLIAIGKGSQRGIDSDSLRAWAERLVKDGNPARPSRNKGVMQKTTQTGIRQGQGGRRAAVAAVLPENKTDRVDARPE